MEIEPSILEVYAISGEWDYLLHLIVQDMEGLEAILMRRIVELDCVAGTPHIFAMHRSKHTTQFSDVIREQCSSLSTANGNQTFTCRA